MGYLEVEDFDRKTYVSTQDVPHKLQRYRCCGYVRKQVEGIRSNFVVSPLNMERSS